MRQPVIFGACVILCVPALCIFTVAQEPQSPFTLQVNTQLVVRTISVKDAEDKPIEGLTQDDFVITENGVPQKISVFEFEKMDDSRSDSRLSRVDESLGREPVPKTLTGSSGEMRYKDRRMLALYFDFEAMRDLERTRALDAASDFVDKRMTVADLVAILTYSGGTVRFVQDFTANRTQLLQTIRTLYDYNYLNQAGVDLTFGQNEGQFNIFGTDRRLMALQTAARMLGVVNGAKSLIYFSSGLEVANQAQLHATMNAAVRGNVVIYPIDSRGLWASAPIGNAGQRSPGGIAMYTGSGAIEATHVFQRSQDTLYTLAAETGGKALLDSNDLALGITQAQRGMSSYYIIGFYSTNPAHDGRVRRLRISLKGRAANLVYRQAYYANKEFSKFSSADKERQLEDALLSEDPITELAIAMELDYFHLNGDKYFVPLTVQIPGNDLLAGQKAGAGRTVIDFIGEIRDESGTTISNLRDKVEIRLNRDVPSRVESSPVHYYAGFALVSGRYVIKFLARNANTGKIGTYQTSLIIPNINEEKRRLPISSVVLGSQRVALTDALYEAEKNAESWNADPLVHDGHKLIPSITRVFSKSQPLYVYLEAYGGNTPGVETVVGFVTFYREMKKIFETPALQFNNAPNVKSTRVPVKLRVPLDNLSIGEYTCQVTVLDPIDQKAAVWQTSMFILP